jgi:hypothetical protein
MGKIFKQSQMSEYSKANLAGLAPSTARRGSKPDTAEALKRAKAPLEPLRIFDSESDDFDCKSDEEDLLPHNTFDYTGSLVGQSQTKQGSNRRERRYIRQGKFINKFMQELEAND